MSALIITTFGEPTLYHGTIPCRFPIRKALALLIYLAVSGQAHPRARLAALFWPEVDDAHALLSLRQTLLRLRQAIGADADEHLITTGDLVRLDLGPGGSLDVTAFTGAITPTASLDTCQQAFHRYTGPFLEHLRLDDAPEVAAWVAAQRTHWATCYDLIAERVVHTLLDSGDSEAARMYAETWVTRHPDCETAYRRLASAQALVGDVVNARLTLATAERMLTDLGLSLSPKTVQVRAQIERDELPPSHVDTTLHLPLVGRQEAFVALRTAATRAQYGATNVALVVGEAGLGKTRLVEAFLAWCQLQGMDVAVGHAVEVNGHLPYQPFAELLRARLAREHAPDDLLEDSWLVELQRLVPELYDRYPDLPPPLNDAAAGTRLVEAISQVGLALARHHPVIWFIDDLHWADDATREALLGVLHRWQAVHAPILVVSTVRSDELAIQRSLAQWRNTAAQTLRLTEVPLSPLTSAQVTQSLTTLLGTPPIPAVYPWLHDETGGNPLYLEYVLHALAERGMMHWHDTTPRLSDTLTVASLAAWLPQSLRGLLLRSVYRLDPTVQQVLGAAAILGAPFADDVLRQVTALDDNTLLAALEAADRALLIRSEGVHFRFAHDKVAEAIAEDLTPARRRLYHRRALTVLATQPRPPAAILFRHAVGAHAWEEAMTYAQQAALAAQQVGAQRDAIPIYEALLTLLTTSPSQEVLAPSLTTDTLETVFGDLARLYGAVGMPEQEAVTLQQLLAEAHQRGNLELEWRTLRDMGWAAWRRQAVDEAEGYFAQALDLAAGLSDAVGQAQAHRGLQLVAERRGDLAQALRHAQQGVHLARTSHRPRLLAQSLLQLAELSLYHGSWEGMCRAIEESLVLFAALANDAMDETAMPTVTFATPLNWQDFFPRIAALVQGQPTAESNRSRQWGAYGLGLLATARLHLGEGATARRALHLAWDIFTERKEPWFQLEYALARMWGWCEAGMLEQGYADARAIMALAATTTYKSATLSLIGPPLALVDASLALFHLADVPALLADATRLASDRPAWYRLLPATRWVTYHALRGEWSAALTATAEAQRLRTAWGAALPWFDGARHYEIEALLRGGERARAEVEVAHLHAHLGTNQRYRLAWLRMQALLDRHAGELAAALTHLSEALTLAEALTLPGETWHLLNEQAACSIVRGDADAAHAARQHGEAVIMHLAATLTDDEQRANFMHAALSRPPALQDEPFPPFAAGGEGDK